MAKPRGSIPYSSRFQEWDSRASVRNCPRRDFLYEEEAAGKVYFSLNLVPILQHPLVAALGAAAVRELVIQHLYYYLDFTAHFEIVVVNSTAQQIAHGKTGIDLPAEMRIDAYKIYCDEAYHSVFSADLRRQIEAATGIVPEPIRFPDFLQRLEEVQTDVPDDLKSIAGLLIVTLFETLISATLNKIPKDTQVVTAVRDMVADHAEDEARHHVFFSHFMDVLWPQLSRPQQKITALAASFYYQVLRARLCSHPAKTGKVSPHAG